MITEAMDFTYLLLENYKKLKISEIELASILIIEHLINQHNTVITADLMSIKMNLDVKEIDKILANLFKKKFLDFKTVGKNTISTLDPLKEKLFNEYELYVSKEKEVKKSQKMELELENIYTKFESLLCRTLSPVEISKIREWISFGYTDEMIINALKDAISKGKKTLVAVDKILLSYQIRDDVESDGMTSISNDWNRSLEETIKIVKTPWLDDKDEK